MTEPCTDIVAPECRPEVTELAKPNFNFQKREKELAKKRKQEQKRLLKQARKVGDSTDPSAGPADPGTLPAT